VRSLYSSLVLLSAAEPGLTGYRVFPLTGRLHSVRLWGRLHPYWAHRFTLGLSNHGISILNGFARQDGSGTWGADFLVTPTRNGSDPSTVDYLSLTREPPPPHSPPLVIDDFALDGSPERGAVLELEVRGPDRVGFLGSLLHTLGDLGLVPHEMTVVTHDDEACDRFSLKTADGKIPPDSTRAALGAVLDARRRRARIGA
jgi:hypothetical protein